MEEGPEATEEEKLEGLTDDEALISRSLIANQDHDKKVEEQKKKLPRRVRRANNKFLKSINHQPPVAAKMLKPQMRLKHPSYHKFWKDLGELDLKTFRIACQLVISKKSSFSAIERELIRSKAVEYEKLGILRVEPGKKEEWQIESKAIQNGV